MCRKLLLLIAVLGLVGTVWADDPAPPEWRGDPGTTTSWYGFDTNAPTGDHGWPLRAPETSQWFYKDPPHDGVPVGNFRDRAIAENWTSHWEEVGGWDEATWVETPTWIEGDYDMPLSYYEDNFSLQVWGNDQTWLPTFLGRTGVLRFPAGSVDIYNFETCQPWKYFQLQITWQPWNRGEQIAFNAEMEYFKMEELRWNEEVWWETAGWNYGEEEYEGWLSGWPGEEPPPEIWWEEGFWACWGGYETSWWRAAAGWLEEGWWTGGEEPVEYSLGWWDEFLEPIDEIAQEGDWRTSVFYIEMHPNPGSEFFGLFPATWDSELEEWVEGGVIAVDQVVIDTICIPEPATIALLGLGGLALIRRRKR